MKTVNIVQQSPEAFEGMTYEEIIEQSEYYRKNNDPNHFWEIYDPDTKRITIVPILEDGMMLIENKADVAMVNALRREEIELDFETRHAPIVANKIALYTQAYNEYVNGGGILTKSEWRTINMVPISYLPD